MRPLQYPRVWLRELAGTFLCLHSNACCSACIFFAIMPAVINRSNILSSESSDWISSKSRLKGAKRASRSSLPLKQVSPAPRNITLRGTFSTSHICMTLTAIQHAHGGIEYYSPRGKPSLRVTSVFSLPLKQFPPHRVLLLFEVPSLRVIYV